uniref:Uncharacterized protein n=1 Tax=Anguilla anguilla TaxID=7936 RepID=A0A0E9S6W7_ANGAN
MHLLVDGNKVYANHQGSVLNAITGYSIQASPWSNT